MGGDCGFRNDWFRFMEMEIGGRIEMGILSFGGPESGRSGREKVCSVCGKNYFELRGKHDQLFCSVNCRVKSITKSEKDSSGKRQKILEKILKDWEEIEYFARHKKETVQGLIDARIPTRDIRVRHWRFMKALFAHFVMKAKMAGVELKPKNEKI